MRLVSDQQTAASEALVSRAAAGDADAFSELIRLYERTALSVAFSVLADADAASDVVQEAFLRAWQRLVELREPSRFATWLCGIARNLAIDVRRRHKHLKLSSDVSGFEAAPAPRDRWNPAPLDAIDQREQDGRVASALATLDDVTRQAVVLRYYDGVSSKEIGATLGLSPAAVDMRLSRARQQLKNILDDEEPVGSRQVSHG